MDELPPLAFAPVLSTETVTVAIRLFHRQRALLLMLAGFGVGGLLALAIPWVAGPTPFAVGLGAIQFFVLPSVVLLVYKNYHVKPALLLFTAQEFCLQARTQQYQVAWADLVAYKVEFSLAKLVGEGYRLVLRGADGYYSIALNLLEKDLIDPDKGLRADSGLGYLCRYIGQHNREAAATGDAPRIALLPHSLAGKTGWVLLGIAGVLFLVDVGLRVSHPAKSGKTLGTLAMAIGFGLQVLGQKKQNDRYARYLLSLQARPLLA